VLRKELGFEGIVYTDDLSMLAISKIWGVPAACAMAFEAGNDMILMKVNHELRPAIEATKRFIDEGKITEERITASAEKVLRLKQKYGMFEREPFDAGRVTDNVGTARQLEVGRRLARKAVVALKNEDDIFPLDPHRFDTPLVIACRDRSVSVANDPERSHDMLVDNVRRFYPHARCTLLDQAPTKDQIWEIEGLVKNCDLVIFAVHAVRSGEAARGQYAGALEAMEKACSYGTPLVAVITGAPYVAAQFPEAVKGIACSFSVTPTTIEAVVDLMCGKIEQHGKNPVHIDDTMPRGFAATVKAD
jgi:beta-N-acetylhexosaminidase